MCVEKTIAVLSDISVKIQESDSPARSYIEQLRSEHKIPPDNWQGKVGDSEKSNQASKGTGNYDLWQWLREVEMVSLKEK